MLSFKRFLIVIAAIVMLMSLTGTLAKEIVKVTISGPGLTGTVEVTDAEALSLFQNMRFGRMQNGKPSEVGETYYEIRLMIGDGKEIFATDIYHYYLTSKGSYLYYADVLNGWSDAEGKWFRLDRTTDAALRDFIAQQKAASSPIQMMNWLLPLWTLIWRLLV